MKCMTCPGSQCPHAPARVSADNFNQSCVGMALVIDCSTSVARLTGGETLDLSAELDKTRWYDGSEIGED